MLELRKINPTKTKDVPSCATKLCADVWGYQILPFLTEEEALKFRRVSKQAKAILRDFPLPVIVNYLPKNNFIENILRPTVKRLTRKLGVKQGKLSTRDIAKKSSALISLLQGQRKLSVLKLPTSTVTLKRFVKDILPHIPYDLDVGEFSFMDDFLFAPNPQERAENIEAFAACLKRLKNLGILDLSHNPMTSEEFLRLSKYCGEVKILILNSCKNLKFLAGLTNFTNLSELYLIDMPVSSLGLAFLKDIGAPLKVLCVDKFLNPQDFKNLIYCPNLSWLSLSFTNITHNELLDIGRYCPRLEVLLLKGCKSLQNFKFLEHFSNLEWLSLVGTSISSFDLLPFAQYCPNLRTLDLSYCKEVHFLLGLVGCKKLNVLHLQGTPVRSMEELAYIQVRLPGLQIKR